MISKKRYYGLALPIWVCEDPDCQHFHVVGDETELEERAIEGWETFAGHSPHRPYIDAVKITCPACGGKAKRITDVGNPWLDAGIVAYSTLGYRDDPDFWEKWFPADWISESFPGQFRNWFYSLLTMSTILERRAPFKHAGEDRHGIRLPALARELGGPGASQFQVGLDVRRRNFEARRTAVDDRAQRGAVALAEGGHRKEPAYRVTGHDLTPVAAPARNRCGGASPARR